MSNRVYKPTRLESLFAIRNTDAGDMYNLLQTVYIQDDLDPRMFTEYNVRSTDSWTTISYNKYGSIEMWWLIYTCNRAKVKNPVDMPPAGTTIKLPTQMMIREIVSRVRK